MKSGLLLLEPERARADVDNVVELTTAKELAKTVWRTVPIAAYPSLRVGHKGMVVLVGSRGSGKSSMAARMVDTTPGPALIYSAEEPAGPSVADRLDRLGVKGDDLLVCSRATVDQLAELLQRRKVVSMAIDSVQRSMFEPREIRHLLSVIPTLSLVVCVSQVNQHGEVRGGEELGHECDVLIQVANLEWEITKSRYQPEGRGKVLAPESSGSGGGLHVVSKS